MKRVGVFGGTFNPPHLGHLRIAEEVAQDYCLDEIVFMPSHIPPHKSIVGVAPAPDRLEMTQIACRGNDIFSVSSMEIEAKGLSYTVHTLESMAQNYSADIFFILGTDSLREICTWKQYESLFSLAHFLVVSRVGITFDDAWGQMPRDLRSEFKYEGKNLLHTSGKQVLPTGVQGLDISATRIREMVKSGKSIRYLVTGPVRNYILQRGLYTS